MSGMDGKVALVLGSASGIGRATALTFAREGARLILGDIDDQGGERVARAITEQGGEAVFTHVDVALGADVRGAVGLAAERFGRLDCAHNNVGVARPPFVRLHEVSEENWDAVVRTNLTGMWLALKYEVAQMLEQGHGGAIVNTASAVGLVGSETWSGAYSPSKHGVVGLTRTAALEYAKDGIRINAVAPGTVRTPAIGALFAAQAGREQRQNELHPNGRAGEPEEVAEAVVWLCSDAASLVNGHTLSVDGGYVIR